MRDNIQKLNEFILNDEVDIGPFIHIEEENLATAPIFTMIDRITLKKFTKLEK